MKIILTFLFSVAFAFTSIAQNKVSTISTSKTSGSPAIDSVKTASKSISLKETEFDFGKIPQGKPVTHIFEFTNTGATSVSLDNVQASCGCTTPDWNKDVVAPGASSKITVGYNAQNEGPFAKPVTITYNGNQVKQIIIKGEVWKTPVTSAPENSSVNSLKNEQ
ncbi:MAG: DUF1573 domain-containing protein [Ginsengibacter sp.]